MDKSNTGWEFSRISRTLTFMANNGEPEIVHFIRTGLDFENENSYHVIQEDVYGLKPDGEDFLMSSSDINTKFNINIDAEFEKRLNIDGHELSVEEIRTLINENLIEKNGAHTIDYPPSVDRSNWQTKAKFFNELNKIAKNNNIQIILNDTQK